MALRKLSIYGAEQKVQKRLGTDSSRRSNRRRDLVAYLFLSPYLLLFGAFTLLPALGGIAVSFTHWDIVGAPTFVGLENFQQVLGDELFHQAVFNTLYFMVLAAVPLIALGLGLALLLNQKIYGRTLARTILYMPQVVMISVVGLVWVWMYDQSWGLINYYLGMIGIPPIGWLSDVNAAMPAIAITTIWWTVGSNMIIYLAGLQDIPEELYEAARIDGAGAFARFIHITWPSLNAVNTFVIPLTVVGCWRVFGQAYVMTGGGPQGRTFVIAQYIYQTAFQNFQMGPASAAAVILLLITLTFTVIQLRAMRVF